MPFWTYVGKKCSDLKKYSTSSWGADFSRLFFKCSAYEIIYVLFRFISFDHLFQYPAKKLLDLLLFFLVRGAQFRAICANADA